MSSKLVSLALGFSTLVATEAAAQRYQDVQPRYESGRQEGADDFLYLGGYSRDTEAGEVVVDFYTRQDRSLTNDGIRFGAIPFARRSIRNGGSTSVLGWADGARCGQLGGVLREYARLSPPTFQVPYLYQAPPSGSSAMGGPPMRVHPVDSSVWGRARQADGAPSIMTLSGSDGLIDQWTAFAESELKDCWVDQSPIA